MRIKRDISIILLLMLDTLAAPAATQFRNSFEKCFAGFASEAQQAIGPRFVVTADVKVSESDTVCVLSGTKERSFIYDGEYYLGTTCVDGILIDFYNVQGNDVDINVIISNKKLKKENIQDNAHDGQIIYVSKKYELIHGKWVDYDDGGALFGPYYPKQGELLFPNTNSVALYYDGGARYLVLNRHINRTFHLIFVTADNNIYGTWRYNNGVLYLRPASYSDEDHVIPVRLAQSDHSSLWWDGIPLLMRFQDSMLRDCTEYSDLWDMDMYMSYCFSRVY